MNTLIILKGFILVALGSKFVRSDDADETSTPAEFGSTTGGDISSIYDPGFPNYYFDDDFDIQDSDDVDIEDSADDVDIEDSTDLLIEDSTEVVDIDIKDSRDQAPIIPPIPEKEDEDIFDRNHGSFPDGWHTYQGGNQLRGIEDPTKDDKLDSGGSVPMKPEEVKKGKKGKKTKSGEKGVKRESGMPVGAIAVMVTSGCVLVVAVAVAITIRK